MKIYIPWFLENLTKEFDIHYNLTRIMDTLHKDLSTFTIISSRILLIMRNISEKQIAEKIKTHILCSVTCFPKIRLSRKHVEK